MKLFGNEWAMLWQGLLQITIIKFKIINKYKPQQPAKECNTTVCIGCLIVKQDKRPAAASGYVKFEGIMPVAGNNYKLDKEFHHRQTQAELNSQHFHQICILWNSYESARTGGQSFYQFATFEFVLCITSLFALNLQIWWLPLQIIILMMKMISGKKRKGGLLRRAGKYF